MRLALRFKIASAEPVRRGIDHYWAVIRELGKDGRLWTVGDVLNVSFPKSHETLKTFLRRLVSAGIAEIAVPGASPNTPAQYRLLARPVATPKIGNSGTISTVGDGQLNMWTAMRRLKAFSIPELAIAATTDECRVARSTAKCFCRLLKDAGALQVLSTSKRRVYRLKPSANTGPKPPVVLRCSVVWDQNKGRPIGDVIAEERAP